MSILVTGSQILVTRVATSITKIEIAKRVSFVSVSRGRRGETGATGEQGPPGDQGEQGPQGPPGASSRTDLAGTVALDADDANDVLHTNNTAAATAVLPPSADIGSNYYAARFRVTSDNPVRIEVQGSDVIRYGGVSSTELTCDDRDGALNVEYVGGGVYLASAIMGAWVEDE